MVPTMFASTTRNLYSSASALQDELEGQHADHEVDDVGGGQQLQPVHDRAERLTEQHGLGGLDGAQQQRDHERQEQHREEQLPGADLGGDGGEERAEGGEADRAEGGDER